MGERNPVPYAIGTCQICGKEFRYLKTAYSGKYCSRKCKHIGHRKPESYVVKQCVKCGKVFTSWVYFNQKYCSQVCYGRTKHNIEKQCLQCGKLYYTIKCRREKSKFCSRLCQNTWQARQQIKSPPNPASRLCCVFWKGIRKAVLLRDGHACQKCGSSFRLMVHHIVPWRISHDDGPDNLITLCQPCHVVADRPIRNFLVFGKPMEAPSWR